VIYQMESDESAEMVLLSAFAGDGEDSHLRVQRESVDSARNAEHDHISRRYCRSGKSRRT